MSPKKRSKANQGLPDNLYRRVDRRNGKVYYNYLDQRTGKRHGLGSDHREAVKLAKELNAVITHQLAKGRIDKLVAGKRTRTMKIEKWVERYNEMQREALERGDIKKATLDSRRYDCNAILKHWKGMPIGDISTKDCATLIGKYKKAGKERMAQSIRTRLIDLFAEAISAGEMDPVNPALLTKTPRADTKRARLTLEQWKKIYSKVDKRWARNALLLALVTGQRLSDVATMKFSDVEGDYLKVEQIKTGNRIKIPLDLRMESIDVSVREAVSQCRDNVVSQYLCHHSKYAGMAKPGDKIRDISLSAEFRNARNKTSLAWDNPPSFHEMRSLAEREYSKQGVDTKTLLGHRHQKMTDKYHDAKGAEWVVVR